MGCVYSRSESESSNPRVFQVWNVDEEGRNVKPGKIEVTESQLILYQRGDITVRWPLRSLRRYGFDAELFSFECGRRCPTGPGVYAFRCRRAEALFNILQEFIQNSGGGAGIGLASLDDQISLATAATSNGTLVNGSIHNSSQRQQSPAVDSSGYLEPITAGTHLGQGSFGTSASRMSAGSPGGFVCIHALGNEGMAVEWSALPTSNSFPACGPGSCNRSSANYVNRDVADNQTNGFSGNGLCLVHQYVNSSVVDPSRRCCSQVFQQDKSENTYMNSTLGLSPGHLPCSSGGCTMNCMNCVDVNTNYAKLDDLLKQEQTVKRHKEQQHFYVNVKPDKGSVSSTTMGVSVSGNSTPIDSSFARNGSITSPTIAVPTNVQRSRFYANLGSPTLVDSLSVPSELAKSTTQVNYAILDLDKCEAGNNNNNNNNASSSQISVATSGNSLPNSPSRTPEGYAQIDFDKTVALSNSAIPCPLNDDSVRKTRHNAVIPCASMPS